MPLMPMLEALFPDGLTDDRLLGGRVRIAQPADGYRVAVDPILLAAAVPAQAGETVADLGAGSGAVGLCLTTRVAGCRIVAVEREGDLTQLVRANAATNGLSGALQVIQADVTSLPLCPASMDHVAMNPPFLAAGSATEPTQRLRRVAAVEGSATLPVWIARAWDLARAGGTISLIHRADRLDEIIAACRQHQRGGLIVLPIWSKPGQAAHRVIIRLRKGDRSPFRLAAGLVLHQPDGGYTQAAEAVLRDALALAV
jgi:tRNA1(Val) A37 N6-methylase TrmN6